MFAVFEEHINDPAFSEEACNVFANELRPFISMTSTQTWKVQPSPSPNGDSIVHVLSERGLGFSYSRY